MSKEFGVSLEIMTLAGLTMVALGGGFGPLFWGPLSERYGRRPTMLASQFLLFILQLGFALAPNIGTVFAMQFLTGFLAWHLHPIPVAPYTIFSLGIKRVLH